MSKRLGKRERRQLRLAEAYRRHVVANNLSETKSDEARYTVKSSASRLGSKAARFRDPRGNLLKKYPH